MLAGDLNVWIQTNIQTGCDSMLKDLTWYAMLHKSDP
jgi:hypothetical protein